jgi:hypothetical protein
VHASSIILRTGFSLAKEAGRLDKDLLEQATRLVDRPVQHGQGGKGDGKGWHGGKASGKGKGPPYILHVF